MSMVI